MSSTSDQRSESHKGNYTLVGLWLRRLGESYIGAWLLDLFQSSTQAMASAAAAASSGPTPTSSHGGGGPLSFMGCMREASPPPFDDHPPPHLPPHHHHQRPVGLPTGECNGQMANGFDSMPKEPKKRRFHPLRGLRRIFRKKSRGAADARLNGCGASSGSEREASLEHMAVGREEVTLRDPSGSPDEIRSRSASELLTDSSSCERDRIFPRRCRGTKEPFANLQRGSGVGQLSVSHDSVFPGEVPHTRPLSSLDMHASLERRSTKASGNNDTDHKDSNTAQRHRISLRVLEQIKTVIESRNQIAAAATTATATTTTTTTITSSTTESANSSYNRFASRDRATAAGAAEDTQGRVLRKDVSTPTNNSATDAPNSPFKEDLLELTAGSLNHTAAKHRISVRPKNRRPPRRSTSQSSSINNTSNGLPRIDSISELSIDTLDSLEGIAPVDNSIGSLNRVESPVTTPLTPTTPPIQEQQQSTKPTPILRKSSSRLSRKSEMFEELEAKLPVLRKPAVSPDSLDSNLDSRSSGDVLDVSEDSIAKIQTPPKPTPRTASTGSEGFEKPVISSSRRRSSSNRLSKSPDSLESNSPGWFTKSTEGFDKLSDFERDSNSGSGSKPVAAARRLLINPISKSQERVCCTKSSDSLEALEALNSDDSMERRRSSFEIRPRRNQVHKVMSKSTDCFESTLVEHQQLIVKADEKRKRTSLSEVNLSRGSSSASRHNKLLSKSSESFEKISNLVENQMLNNALNEKNGIDSDKSGSYWRVNRRIAHSSESSDNLDLDDNCKLENRNKSRKSTPKRLSNGNGNGFVDEQENVILRKPSRLQKNSESSELGSTDTLDSERRNTIKSSDSDETLDSLEKDLQEQSQQEQDRKDEETMESILEIREKNNEEDEKVGSYWRRRTDSQDIKGSPNNLDIHQLLAYTLVSKIQENGNNDDNNEENHDEDRTLKTINNTSSIVYPKKKQHQQQIQQQSSSEDNKTLSSTINNLLSSKTDEDLQNMLNGNISEVSTDTKSFKEKLIMFEKLGK